MSNTFTDEDDVLLESTEEAMRLLDLSKSQRGGQKKLTEGQRYLVITQEYLETYGHLFDDRERKRIETRFVV
jgi:hypothetical protein